MREKGLYGGNKSIKIIFGGSNNIYKSKSFCFLPTPCYLPCFSGVYPSQPGSLCRCLALLAVVSLGVTMRDFVINVILFACFLAGILILWNANRSFHENNEEVCEEYVRHGSTYNKCFYIKRKVNNK